MCATADKAPSEKIGKGERKKKADAGEAFQCNAFQLCNAEDIVDATVSAVSPKKQKKHFSRPPASSKSSCASTRSSTEASTRASTEASESLELSQPTSPMKPASAFKPKVNKIRLEKNLEKVRKCVREVVGQLNHFQVWVKTAFSTPDACFEALARDAHTPHMDLDSFVCNVQIQGFKGSGEMVFHGLCDTWSDGLVITRVSFVKRLKNMGCPLLLVVRQAMSANAKKMQQRRAKHRNATLKKDDIDRLIFFRDFVEPLFDCPDKVFDDIAGDDGTVDEDEFTEWLADHNFPGDAKEVFHCFAGSDGVLGRITFSEMLLTCKKLAEGKAEILEKKQEDDNGDEPTKAKAKGKKKSSRQGKMLSKAHAVEAKAAVEGEALKKPKRQRCKSAGAAQAGSNLSQQSCNPVPNLELHKIIRASQA